MKKHLPHIHSLLLIPLSAFPSLLSMDLNESVMVPKERGLGFYRSVLDVVWDHQEENLYKDLVNKTFNPYNTSYHHKLDTAIELYVSKNNNNRITQILTLCTTEYPRQIKIGDSQSRIAHDFLVQENKNKQKSLKDAIETKDKQFIAQQNALLNELQKSIPLHLNKMNDLFTEHIKESNALVVKEGDEIRRLKTGLIHLHTINKTFKLPQDGYCSDSETDAGNIKNSYNDKHILEKIEVYFSMNETKTKIKKLLKLLHDIDQELQGIQPIRY